MYTGVLDFNLRNGFKENASVANKKQTNHSLQISNIIIISSMEFEMVVVLV